MERGDIVMDPVTFLRQTKLGKRKRLGKSCDETWLNENHTASKSWTDDTAQS